MRAALGSVKRLLIQTLLTKASHRDSLFNLMTYSGQLSCWSHHMLPCAPDTVYISLSWIHSISCSPGRDLLTALSVALADPTCHAVHLLCMAPPDHPDSVLRALPALTAGRPVNVFYLLDSGAVLDPRTQDFLQCLTQTTRGSCYVIGVGLNGVLEKAVPLCAVGNQSVDPSDPRLECLCSASSAFIPHSASSPLLSGTLSRAEFFPGCRVLARREVDGFYYSGTLIQQVQGCGGVWLVDFDHPGSSSLGVVPSHRQLVCSLDMVNHSRAHTHSLGPGAAVLAPWGPDLRRYGPGRVTVTTEQRGGFGVDAVACLRVLMWNGSLSLVPDSLVVPISAPQHDRITRELQILKTPASGGCCSWVCARTSCCQFASCCRDDTWPSRCGSSFGRTGEPERPEQDAQVALSDTGVRKSDPDGPPSSSSSVSLCEDESRQVKVGSKQQRPPWRYWRRTGPEPQHRQPGGAAVPRRTSQPVRFRFPVPQISASPNHSSLFQSLPVAKGRGANIRDVFGATNFKPRPPAGLRPLSANNTTAVYT
ncbi:uncharacterized protein C11orf16 homolog [Halichoeres trimaculatus]|uniref:uncharacterized protein C11orf16 homolog n=1 Tax=Halichoeres trimaculatus TaxID=147232 RepID=UPI003D9E483E